MANISVLLVDDERTARDALARRLKHEAEFDVVTVDSGPAALEHLARVRTPYTALLMDYVLDASMSGEELLEHLKDHYGLLPVIVFTGIDRAGGARAIARGAYRYMPKPINFGEMVNIVRGLAEHGMLFRQIAEDVRQILRSDMCLAWRVDEQNHRLCVVEWSGNKELDDDYRKNVFLNLDDPAVREHLEQGRPIYLRDVTNPELAPRYRHRAEAKERGWTSLISIPLMRQQRVIGLVDSYTYKPRILPQREQQFLLRDVLPSYARQAAEAIRNANLAAQLRALQGINERIASSFGEKTILQYILEQGIELVGANSGWLYSLRGPDSKLMLEKAFGMPQEAAEPERALGDGITGIVAQTGEALIVPDVSHNQWYKAVAGVDVKSEVAVPLRREEQTIGVLVAKSRWAGTFSRDDENLLMSLASQAATVIGRAKLFQHMYEVSRLSHEGDRQRLAQYVVDAANDLTAADAILWEVSSRSEDNGGVLRILANKGEFSPQYLEKAVIPLTLGTSITALAIDTGEPIVRDDVLTDTQEPRFHNIGEAQKRNTRAFMTIPLRGREGDTIGALNLYSHEVKKFKGGNVQSLLRTLANQAMLAFDNLRFKRESEARLRDLTIITDVVSTMSSLLEVSDVLKHIVSQIAEKLDCNHCAYFEPQEKVDGLRLVPTMFRDRRPHRQLDREFVPGEGVVGWCFVHGDSVLLADARRDERFAESLTETSKPLSMLLVPVKIGGQTIGVISADQDEYNWFSPRDRQLVEALAAQAAIAIQRAAGLEVIQTLTERLMSAPNLRVIMEEIVRGAQELVSADNGIIYVLSDDQRGVVASYQYSADYDHPPPRLKKKRGLTYDIINSGKPVAIVDTKSHHGASRAIKRQYKSLIGVPLIDRSRVIGVLYLNFGQTHSFSETEKSLLQILADQGTVAIRIFREYTGVLVALRDLDDKLAALDLEHISQ